MAIYALTGGATGIGAALKDKLRARGDTVIVVDIQAADIVADLSTVEGRQSAVAAIFTHIPVIQWMLSHRAPVLCAARACTLGPMPVTLRCEYDQRGECVAVNPRNGS